MLVCTSTDCSTSLLNVHVCGLVTVARSLYSAGGGTLNALMEVVFPPQSTYWYISWETCSA